MQYDTGRDFSQSANLEKNLRFEAQEVESLPLDFNKNNKL